MLSPDKTKSVEFVSDQYDDLIAFKVSANEELEEIRARLDKISETCDRIQKSLDAFELYSYQFNIKIVGMPMVAEREHPEQTASLCLYSYTVIFSRGSKGSVDPGYWYGPPSAVYEAVKSTQSNHL